MSLFLTWHCFASPRRARATAAACAMRGVSLLSGTALLAAAVLRGAEACDARTGRGRVPRTRPVASKPSPGPRRPPGAPHAPYAPHAPLTPPPRAVDVAGTLAAPVCAGASRAIPRRRRRVLHIAFVCARRRRWLPRDAAW